MKVMAIFKTKMKSHVVEMNHNSHGTRRLPGRFMTSIMAHMSKMWHKHRFPYIWHNV